jgi:hypothetical protein
MGCRAPPDAKGARRCPASPIHAPPGAKSTPAPAGGADPRREGVVLADTYTP